MSPAMKPPANSQQDLVGLNRSPLFNQWRAIADSLTKRAPGNNMHGLVDVVPQRHDILCLTLIVHP